MNKRIPLSIPLEKGGDVAYPDSNRVEQSAYLLKKYILGLFVAEFFLMIAPGLTLIILEYRATVVPAIVLLVSIFRIATLFGIFWSAYEIVETHARNIAHYFKVQPSAFIRGLRHIVPPSACSEIRLESVTVGLAFAMLTCAAFLHRTILRDKYSSQIVDDLSLYYIIWSVIWSIIVRLTIHYVVINLGVRKMLFDGMEQV